MSASNINGIVFLRMLSSAAANLKKHEEEVNDLNVFPIPDGDTGSNMLLTLLGGVSDPDSGDADVGKAAKTAADGMLMCARGNSGVILSQFFSGMADGLARFNETGRDGLAAAFEAGVRKAYGAVLEPVEGTVLTVARESSEFAGAADSDTPEKFLGDVVEAAKRSLARTPELLKVLKDAGVVDSGGAGFIYIVEGMKGALTGETGGDAFTESRGGAREAKEIDYERFTSDSVLEYGYCTEVLVRLQNSKCDVENFDVGIVRDFLQTVGDSIVAFRSGSALKIHVHTMTPDRVLAYCRRYGEFLTVKIENMSLQHSNLDPETAAGSDSPKKHITTKAKPFGIVCVASGEGVARCFRDLGADEIISGGQSMNPSTKDFIDAFSEINAEHIIVFPNNSNIILAAQQAASIYKDAKVTVVNSVSIGQCHAALTIMNPLLPPDEMISEMEESMSEVVTAAVSRCVRDAHQDVFDLHSGQYIGFTGKKVVSADNDRFDTARMLVDALDFGDREVCIIFSGREAVPEETEELKAHIERTRPFTEVYCVNGEQEIYDYIIVLE